MAKKIQIVGLDIPQADFNQTDETQLDYIKNKPDIDGMIGAAETRANDYADQLAGNYDSAGSAEAVQDALDEYIESNDTELSSVKKTHADDKAELQTAIDKKSDITTVDALTERVGDNETAIKTLNGSGEGSVDKKINDAFNDFATNVSNDATVNTYKELIDYAATHGEEFTELVGEVDANAKAIDEHKKLINPHGVTRELLEIENVPNVTTNDQTPTFTEASTLENIASGEKVTTLFGKIKKAITDLIAHLANKSNPHDVSLNQLVDTETYVKMTPAEREKLLGIADGAEVNVQADWTQTSTTSDDYIKNKPTLGGLAAKSTVVKSDLASDVQASLDKADTAIQSHQDISGKVDKVDGKGLSTNDFTDAYKNKVDSALQSYSETDPTVPDWAKAANKPSYDLGEVSDTQNYVRMTPAERTKLSGIESDANKYVHPESHTADMITGLSKVATSGSYNDLTDQPTIPSLDGYAKTSEIPTKVSQLDNDEKFLKEVPSEYITATELESKKYLTSVPEEYVTDEELIAKGYLTEHQSLDGYAKTTDLFSKSYNDLTDKPDIPTVPTQVSAFNNDAGYLTSYTETDPTVPSHVKAITTDDISSWNSKSTFSGSYNDLDDKPDLNNYVTTEQFETALGDYINAINELLGEGF